MTDLEQRIQRLEDIESIRALKARYCLFCDDNYNVEGLASVFTEGAQWDGGNTFGRADGRDAIRRHFEGASKRVSIARHQVMNPIIEIDGDTATGHWLLFQPCTNAGPDGEEAVWLAATYADTYERASEAIDGWLISSTLIDVAFFSRFDQGWVEQPFLPGRQP